MNYHLRHTLFCDLAIILYTSKWFAAFFLKILFISTVSPKMLAIQNPIFHGYLMVSMIENSLYRMIFPDVKYESSQLAVSNSYASVQSHCGEWFDPTWWPYGIVDVFVSVIKEVTMIEKVMKKLACQHMKRWQKRLAL